MLLDSLILLILPHSLFSLSDLYSRYSPFSLFSFSGRMLGIRCSRPRSEAERAQVSRPQAGARAVSECAGGEEQNRRFGDNYCYSSVLIFASSRVRGLGVRGKGRRKRLFEQVAKILNTLYTLYTFILNYTKKLSNKSVYNVHTGD